VEILSQSFSGAVSISAPPPPPTNDDDDDFSSLIIPPPPSSSSSHSVDEVRVVPPVPRSVSMEGGGGDKKEKERKKFPHKRSSSVDMGSLNQAKQILEEEERQRKCVETQQRSGAGSDRDTPPVDLTSVKGVDDCVDSHEGFTDAESPATVSMKLHQLLKSLPTLAPEVAIDHSQSQQPGFFLHRTGSLRLPCSASLDRVVPGVAGASGSNSGASGAGTAKTKFVAASGVGVGGGDGGGRNGNSGGDGDAAQAFTGKVTHRMLFSGTASLGRVGGRRAVSQEYLTSSGIDVDGAGGVSSSSSLPNKDSSASPQSPTESFASLKAKLKDYRDQLLRRNSSRKSSSSSSSGTGGGADSDSVASDTKKSDSKSNDSGSFKRSGSFSRLLSQLSGGSIGRKFSKARSSPVLVADGNWTLRHKGESSSTGDLHSLFVQPASSPTPTGEEEKGKGGGSHSFGLNPRSNLRPVSTTADATQVRYLMPIFSCLTFTAHLRHQLTSRVV
jgi:hypothetical protein